MNVQFKTTKTILLFACSLGLLLTLSLMSGDEQGRVNLLYLLLLYVFIPVFSFVVSILSVSFGHGFNFAYLVSLIPFWPSANKREFLILNQQTKSKWILLYQSQLAAVCFSLASLSVFIILLVTTDINFVWRSTILNAEQIYPLLKWLATPWSFWQSAQPDLSLLKLTQDSRMLSNSPSGTVFGNWWQFILATQIFYALLLRFISMLVCLLALKKDVQPVQVVTKHSTTKVQNTLTLVDVIQKIESDFSLVNWCAFPENKIKLLLQNFQGNQISELKAGPLASYSEQMVAERWQGELLILVKGWEPPLAELADFMENGTGYLIPLDWNEQTTTPLKEHHLNEWRRFMVNLKGWQLVQLSEELK